MANTSDGGGYPAEPPVGIYTTHKENMWRVIPPMLIVWGVVGNILTILVVGRQMRRVTSTGIYLLVLAFSDILVLLCAPVRQWILWKWDIDVRNLSQSGCKIHKYLTYASFQFSSWLLVAVTLERAISVVFPHRVRNGCTPKLATIVLCVIFICIFGLNAHFLYGFGEVHIQGETYACYVQTDSYKQFMEDIWPWIDFCVVLVIPFAFLLVSNVVIITKLYRTKMVRRQMSVGQDDRLAASENANQTIMIILVVLSVVFFISMTPVNVFYIIYPYRQRAIDKLMATDPLAWWRAIEYMTFWEAIVNIIGYANSSFNFVLYVFSGSRFRAELKALFTCGRTGTDSVFSTSADSRKTTRMTSQSTLSNKRSFQDMNADESDAYVYRGQDVDISDNALVVQEQHGSSVKLHDAKDKAGTADITDTAGDINGAFHDDEHEVGVKENTENNTVF